MAQPTLDESELTFLITLSKTQSLSITANQLGMSLSTASRHLQDARAIFGDPLFMRSGQKMFPTSKMSWLLPDIVRTRAMLSQLVNPRTFVPEESRRFYRIASLDCAYTMFIEPAIEKCLSIAPGVSFQVVPFNTSAFEALSKGILDMLVFGYEAPVQEYIHKVVLGEWTYALLLRGDHPLRLKYEKEGVISKEDIEKYECIGIRSAFSMQRPSVPMPWFDDEVQTSNIDVPYFLSAALSVAQSDRLLLVPLPFAKRVAAQVRGLSSVPFAAFTNRRWRPTLFWHERTHAEPEMQWLRGIIQSSVDF